MISHWQEYSGVPVSYGARRRSSPPPRPVGRAGSRPSAGRYRPVRRRAWRRYSGHLAGSYGVKRPRWVDVGGKRYRVTSTRNGKPSIRLRRSGNQPLDIIGWFPVGGYLSGLVPVGGYAHNGKLMFGRHAGGPDPFEHLAHASAWTGVPGGLAGITYRRPFTRLSPPVRTLPQWWNWFRDHPATRTVAASHYGATNEELATLGDLGVETIAGLPQPSPKNMTSEQFDAWIETLEPEAKANWEEANWSIRGMVELGHYRSSASPADLEAWLQKVEPFRFPTWAKISLGVGGVGLGAFLLWKMIGR